MQEIELVKVYLKEGTTIECLFSDGLTKRYDVLKNIKEYPQLNKLKDRKIFENFDDSDWGGISWNDELDISSEEIYENGIDVSSNESVEPILLGYEIKKARLKKQYSQAKLSKLTGIEQADISKIENGLGNPTLSTILRICKCLEVKFIYHLA